MELEEQKQYIHIADPLHNLSRSTFRVLRLEGKIERHPSNTELI